MPRKESGNARKVTSVRLLSFGEGLALGLAINKYNETAAVPITVSDLARMPMPDFCRAQGVAWPGDEKEHA